MVSKHTPPFDDTTRVGAPHDPEDIRRLGYRIVDIIADELADTARRPVNPPPRTPAEMERLFGGALPVAPSDPDKLLDSIRDQVLPSTANYNHPKLICYVSSSTTPVAGLLESLVSTLRLFPYTWAMTPACTHIETTVVRWLGEMVGFSDNAAGYMTTGGSWANLMGLAAARTRQCAWKVTEEGLAGHPALTVYVSEEGHSCLDQCMRLMGLGSAQLRRIPVDDQYRIRLDALETAIKADKDERQTTDVHNRRGGHDKHGRCGPDERAGRCGRATWSVVSHRWRLWGLCESRARGTTLLSGWSGPTRWCATRTSG